jgi:hypothetical protein
MSSKYIDCETFHDFKENQKKLIGILNHNMTKMSYDIKWLKQLTAIQLGVIITTAVGICIGSII